MIYIFLILSVAFISHQLSMIARKIDQRINSLEALSLRLDYKLNKLLEDKDEDR